MTTQIICIPIADDGQVGHSWGKAHTVAIAAVRGGAIQGWRTETVRWDIAHDEGTEGSHHARVARFVRANGITTVVATHMGTPMQNMLLKLGMRVQQGAVGDARAAVLAVDDPAVPGAPR